MSKVWRNFEEYPDYMISNDGWIRRKSNGYQSKGHLCGDYLRFVFHNKSSKKRLAVHRVVASIFLDNKKNKTMVNHKNGVKTDNNVDNLEWCTAKENVRHAWDLKLTNNYGEGNGRSKIKARHAKAIKVLKDIIPVDELEELFGIKRTAIRSIQENKSWIDI